MANSPWWPSWERCNTLLDFTLAAIESGQHGHHVTCALLETRRTQAMSNLCVIDLDRTFPPPPPFTASHPNMASSNTWADVFEEVASFVRLAGGKEERGDYSGADDIVERLDRYIRIVYIILIRLRTNLSPVDAEVEELLSSLQVSCEY